MNDDQQTESATQEKSMLEKVFLRTTEVAAQAVTSPPAFSGLKDLDKLILDWQRPLLVVVTGESGAGRSALAGQIATHRATNEQAVVYSIDLPAHTLVVRLVTSRAHIDATRILSGQANDRDWERMAQAAGWLSDQDIWSEPMTQVHRHF